ncbi:MAG: amidohydrolase family protein [Alphaproteobacteria bacterium]|nr:amidohydrolase family protein [Alphaproteobacteria bacterium]
MTRPDALLTNALLPNGRRADIALADGKIAAITDAQGTVAAGGGAAGGDATDLGGALVLPGLCDGHLHLDKTLLGLPWMGHAAGPTRMSRIETDKKILPNLPLATAERASNLIKLCAAHGSAHLRTHVDIDLEGRLSKLEGVLAARAAASDYATVQIVAFPQSGVMRRPGTLELLDAAVREGADLVGGIDPLEIDRDPKGQLDGIFAIAERRGVGLDIHLHEPGDMGLFNVQEICARTKAAGLGGRVTISHGFCLGDVAESKAKAAAELMAEAGVMLVTHGAAGWALPPIAMLREAGVTVFAGNDDIRDTWSPYGTGDVLARAALIGWRADFRRDDQVMIAYDLVTDAAARAMHIADYGLKPGAPANFFTMPSRCVPEALSAHPPRALVFHRGRIVAKDGAALDRPLEPGATRN